MPESSELIDKLWATVRHHENKAAELRCRSKPKSAYYHDVHAAAVRHAANTIQQQRKVIDQLAFGSAKDAGEAKMAIQQQQRTIEELGRNDPVEVVEATLECLSKAIENVDYPPIRQRRGAET